MYKEPKQNLIFILIISVLLHLLLLIFFLLSRIGDTVKEYKKQIAKKDEAKVIFKKPRPPKPIAPKPKPAKRYVPKLTSGAAGPAISPAAQEQSIDPPLPEKEKPPLPFDPSSPSDSSSSANKPTPRLRPTGATEDRSDEKKKPKPKANPTSPRAESIPSLSRERTEQKKIKKPKPPTVVKTKPAMKKEVVQKKKKPKLTLADVTKNIMQYARTHDVTRRSGMNHLVTITGNNFGKTTAEQLRYERYAAKLLASMRTSLLILMRKFRFVNKPKNDILQIRFTMDVNKVGRIAQLRINKSSGHAQFDKLMVDMVYHAAQSFPPLPAFLKEYDVCAFPINYTVPVAYIPSANVFNHSTGLPVRG